MVNRELENEYSLSIRRLRNEYMAAGMSNEEFRSIYLRTLEQNCNYIRWRRIRYITLVLVITTAGLLAYNFKVVYSILLCNLQDYIYPGLKFLRRMTIPLISMFPSLTDFYHDTCLIQNPFFTVVDMDCWPCSTITSVRYMPEPPLKNYQLNTPFIYKTNQREITLVELKELFLRNKGTFYKELYKIYASSKYNANFEDMFALKDENLYIWKFNTMDMARILRQIIPRPSIVPKFGQSTERFIVFDSSQKSFKVPDTECNYSFLLSLSGSRIILLEPAEECRFQCKTLKVELKEQYLLWYNWWYWRPVVQSSSGNVTLIAHVGSYC